MGVLEGEGGGEGEGGRARVPWTRIFLSRRVASQVVPPPEPRVVRAPRWRWHADGHVEFWDERHDRWQAMQPWTGHVLAALDAKTDYAGLVRVAEKKRIGRRPERKLREFLYTLSRFGYLEIPYDEPPAVYEGRYERLRELGRGGVGIADLCRDRTTGEFVVVKRAWDYLQPFEITETAMRREAETMAAFDHPGIARARDVFERDGHLHLVRDYVEGDDLLQLQHRGLRGESFDALARDLASILAHVHARGYLLLDLRPANFVLALPDRRPRILDVGQCRPHHGGTVTFPARVGSQGFMSPEMEAEKRADTRSDVWGLGRLLFFAATGKLPFAFPDAAALAGALGDHPARAAILAFAADDPASRPADGAAALARLAS